MQFRMQMIFEDNVQLHNTQLVSCTRLLIATVYSNEIILFELLNIYKSQQDDCHVVTPKEIDNVNLDLTFN